MTLFCVVLKQFSAKSEPIYGYVPTKSEYHQSNHQTVKYHQ